ncbi:M3 family metallopeptidase [Escherichia coli]
MSSAAGRGWMIRVGQMRKADGSLQKPVAYLTCNFNRPVNGKLALFTHDEVITCFPPVRSRRTMSSASKPLVFPVPAVCRGMRSNCRSQFMEKLGAGSRRCWR